MRIAGVGVNIKKLPNKETLIEQALKGRAYYQLPKSKALELIEKEIKASGLFTANTKGVEKSDNTTSKNNRRRNNNKQSKHNKASKK